jgi:hypothetical protein
VKAAFISALPPSAVGAARQMGRRLRARSPGMHVLVGVWRHRASLEELEKRLHVSQMDEIVTRIGDAVEQLEAMVKGTRKVEPAAPPPEPRVAHERPALDDGSPPPIKAAS